MLKKILLNLFLVFGICEAVSQKLVEKQLNATTFERIVISSKIINTLAINTEVTDQIRIVSKVVGENCENVVVTTSQENKTLKIGASYSPYFIAENDKLAAHKVISVDVELTIPNFLYVEVRTSIASVSVIGNYSNLQANLENRDCELNNFLGNASIKTKRGNIKVHVKGSVSGRAFSTNGSVVNYLPGRAKYTIVAESRDGDISLLQTK
ncbi:MAG: hypothetical protein ACI83B_001511 [Sediminicola sp.]|jgi:hypothetical protein|tara:strand:- start:164 stop:793 length:630 start_codon:yes stop_codon:yes gene_type:complete